MLALLKSPESSNFCAAAPVTACRGCYYRVYNAFPLVVERKELIATVPAGEASLSALILRWARGGQRTVTFPNIKSIGSSWKGEMPEKSEDFLGVSPINGGPDTLRACAWEALFP
jgi:hypothetical protein